MNDPAEKEARAAELEAEIAQVCGVLNAATGRLVDLIAGVLETESWQGCGIRSASHWVAWKCGVSPARARSLVLMARRLGELPETRAALEAGELCEDQVAVVCRHAPASVDAEAAELARSATVVQLRRVLGSYPFHDDAKGDPTEPREPEAPREPRRVSFGNTDRGTWQLSAELPADEGALVERALVAARDELFQAGQHEPSTKPVPENVDWADALVAMADRSLGGASRGHQDRNLVLLHVGTSPDGTVNGHLHLGPGLGDGLRRFLSCDARVRPVLEAGGRPVSVGRAFRTVPDRTRTVIEERDRGCRVAGCDRSRWLHIHHVEHWEDGGTSDTENLIALCHRHHRLHHLGRLGIRGNADEPDGVLFTDERGRRLAASGRPVTPNEPVEAAARRLGLPAGAWSHPTGEHLDPTWVYFNEEKVPVG
ncbi:MAG: HNH endonuclease [Actinomycetota bacterium]|nr:HNH endonuclease [Actinomycetota bacterium]